MERLGVDLGGVIIPRIFDGQPLSFFRENRTGFLSIRPIEFSIEALGLLNMGRFPGAVFLIIAASEGVEKKSREWLDHWNFQRRTGIPESRIYFCRKGSMKAEIAREIGISRMVDDKIDNLAPMNFLEHRYLFNPREEETRFIEDFLTSVTVSYTWPQLFWQILR